MCIIGEVNIPSGIHCISEMAFGDCKSLKDVTLSHKHIVIYDYVLKDLIKKDLVKIINQSA